MFLVHELELTTSLTQHTSVSGGTCVLYGAYRFQYTASCLKKALMRSQYDVVSNFS